MIVTTDNKYNGVIVDNITLPENRDVFEKEIIQVIESSNNKKLLWIKLPIEKSEFIPILTTLGFKFHHCDEENLMLVKKMVHDSIVPATKNYIVGVGAIVLNEGRILVIKDRFSSGYKLPGVNIEFESIVIIGHFQNGQFGESNLYIVCTAKALTKEITIHDTFEIVEARWISTVEFLKSDDVNNYNKRVVEAAINNRDLKLVEQHIKLKVTDGEVFF